MNRWQILFWLGAILCPTGLALSLMGIVGNVEAVGWHGIGLVLAGEISLLSAIAAGFLEALQGLPEEMLQK